MAADITSFYPYPIKLKFEKVYTSMFLLAKKRSLLKLKFSIFIIRYAGLKKETLNSEDIFEGKGLEFIRRDGCPILV